MTDDLLERARDAYHAEYHRHWRDGGDAQDHDEAHRCGLEAVLELVATPAEVLAERVKEVLGALSFYIGPSARSAVSQESVMRYWRLALARNRVVGEPCPLCRDTGMDVRYAGVHPCRLLDDPAHAARHYDPTTGRRREENA